ncbi:hypothetical protein K490DRAFT_38346 [Saccharata proteae CBS 121410]|uniref:Uncharacterized protein n=1 Tax=Saccharata proteae CBS 121410 TaxID=1314787 RepID=A0A6A5YCC0_9PEZI|nr:hypothetical protein K490DRAFT_38346 [Saccharata proteae CBS 121410]
MRELLLCALLASYASALNITVWRRNEYFFPETLPPSHASSDGEEIVTLFNNLGRTTVWKLVEKTHFEGNTYEPEGMVRLGKDRYFVSAGEYTMPTVKYNGSVINGTDRTAGAGFAHLITFNGQGDRIADATLTERGAIEYHNGGLDFDGTWIWATIAQYRPNTTATVVHIDPSTLEPTSLFHANDHLGGIVHDTKTQKLVTLNWGARNASTWSTKQRFPQDPNFSCPIAVARNPTYFIDYQDCKFLGHSRYYKGRAVMICSGVATVGGFNLGGLALVDTETMIPLAEVPMTMVSDLGVPVTQNPMDVAVVDGQLRFYFLPDQHNSTLYVYEAKVRSPYEFGGEL